MKKLSRLVVLASTLLKLYQKFMVQMPSPTIVSTRLTNPFCAWVVEVGLLVKTFSLCSFVHTVSR
jgi:hypothetical protein